ncbi:hypothetical protein AB0L05_11695 [Nonomuraea pusilla]|uniref:YncE family protein n=1 Tax=Nonomuraea pusilla TaxID=46177 RepID=UPI00331A237A
MISKWAAAVAVFPVVMLPFSATAAPAAAQAGVIRYAVQKSCEKGRACPALRLVRADGSGRALGDASSGEGAVPVAVSADGRRVAYFRKKDRRLVVQGADGGARAVGGVRQPRNEAGVDETRLLLSPDGGKLAYVPNDGEHRVRVFDAGTGRKAGTLPAGSAAWTVGFSGDGGEVLLVRGYDVREAVVADLRGRTLRRVVPPQVVGANLPVDGEAGKVAALAADGRRLAVYVPGDDPGVLVYDVASGAQVTRVPLPAGVVPVAATWTGADEVTVRAERAGLVTTVAVDVAAGTARTVSTYRAPRSGQVYHAGG